MRKLVLFLFVLQAVISSCQLQKVTVNVYTPPKIVYPPDIRSVMVTSRFVPATGSYEDVQWGAYETVDSLKWKLSEAIIDTLAKRMIIKDQFMVKVRHFPRMLRHNEATLPDPLPWDGLLSLSKKEYVQSLLILEGFGLSKSPVTINQQAGEYEAEFSVTVSMAIRVYEPEKMRVLDDSVYTFTSEFKGKGKSEQEAMKQLPEEKKALFSACSQAAEGYYSLIKPGQIPEKRTYYINGDSTMQLGEKAFREGKWGRAEAKWKWLAYNSKDSLIQAKASYNMALICELDGRLNQAIGYARRSLRIHPDRNTIKYINVLDKRISDIENQIKEKKIIRRW
ncbi:MAG: DUF6340 family protein [Bacteroidales bacterium]|jgi:tetratricopeptide (TPR) repeat protein